MKRLSSLKLNQISMTEMEKREMGILKGGTCVCACSTGCSCLYAGPQCSSCDSYYGGSSSSANDNANMQQNANSVGDRNQG